MRRCWRKSRSKYDVRCTMYARPINEHISIIGVVYIVLITPLPHSPPYAVFPMYNNEERAPCSFSGPLIDLITTPGLPVLRLHLFYISKFHWIDQQVSQYEMSLEERSAAFW